MDIKQLCKIFAQQRAITLEGNNGTVKGSDGIFNVQYERTATEEEFAVSKTIECKINVLREISYGHEWMNIEIARGCLQDYLSLLGNSGDDFAHEILEDFSYLHPSDPSDANKFLYRHFPNVDYHDVNILLRILFPYR